jgi:hypothetical protein
LTWGAAPCSGAVSTCPLLNEQRRCLFRCSPQTLSKDTAPLN